jgi:hypothetical protein
MKFIDKVILKLKEEEVVIFVDKIKIMEFITLHNFINLEKHVVLPVLDC